MARKQREISVSEFFAKNRHLLGFDNKRKALLTTVKEAVDNSLDACEEAGILPDLEVAIEQVDEERFRVRVRDNGPGIVKQQIPNIFGKLLYGSKFHRLKMSRGQQGIGISAAGMYGLLTTGKSIKITSRTGKKKEAHYYEIQIDTKKNEPTTINKDQTIEVDWEHGTQVEIELVGSYNKGRQSVDEYLELTAIANPHARFIWKPPIGAPVEFPRASGQLPEHPLEIKPHPHGVELGVLIKMLHDTKSHWLSGFLTSEFCRVGPKMAEEICKSAGLNPRSHPRRIARHEAETLYKAIKHTRLMAPPTNCLSPIGPQQILSGLLKGVKAEFFAASTRPPAVYRGNPFQIEAGIAYGGELGPAPQAEGDGAPQDEAVVRRGKIVSTEPQGAQSRLIRFANRVPLLYQQGACCTYKSVTDTDWRRYGISQPGGGLPAAPLVIMIHMASVWVPFTSESKEAIADYDEIRKEIKLALQDCGRKLQVYLNRRKKQKYEGQRRNVFERYIGELVNCCATIKRINKDQLYKDLLAISTKVTARADEELDDSGRVKKPGADGQVQSEFGENTVVVERELQAPPAESESLFKT
jgi:DNA topoisomerase-6 subunit B